MPFDQVSRRGFLYGSASVLTVSLLAACSSYVPTSTTNIAQVSRSSALAKINEARAAHGKKPVTYNSKLAKAARTHVNLMASKGELSHTLGGNIRSRVRAAGYVGAVGEILAGGQKTLEKAIEDWLASGSHRGVLLSENFTEFGLAVTTGKAPYKTYWAAIFGGSTAAWINR